MFSALMRLASNKLLLAAFVFLSACSAGAPSNTNEASAMNEVANTTEAMKYIQLDTSEGVIVLALDEVKAPISVANFIEYVESGYYDGTIFHRVIPGFMVQGGGFDTSFNEGTTRAPIKNEADNGLQNLRGTVAMARTMDVNSATAQFFINLQDNSFLDHGTRDFGYAVFGKVVKGMDTVDAIAAIPTSGKMGHQDVPTKDIIIERAQVLAGAPE